MNLPSFAIAAILTALLGAGITAAQSQTHQHPPLATASAAAPSPTAAVEMSDGEVRKVDKDAKKITLKHGPIKNLDMPAMTMVFQVRDLSLLDRANVGAKIKFTAEQREGAYVLTAIEASPGK